MKKMPTLFVREYHNEILDMDIHSVSINQDGTHGIAGNIKKKSKGFTLTDQVTPGCEWVLNGEGVATRKYDGTCVLIHNGEVFKRYDAKNGKTPPIGFVPAQPDADPITGHWPGWIPLDAYPDKWIQDAINNHPYGYTINGTYEAIGPKINGNKDQSDTHRLMKHGDHVFSRISNCKLSFNEIKLILSVELIEGIVFHHPDGRMCKIKRSDFGLKW